MFLDYSRKYLNRATNQRDHMFRLILSSRLTLDRAFFREPCSSNGFFVTNRTPFKEVVVAEPRPLVDPDDFEVQPSRLEDVRDAIRKVIDAHWDPTEPHIVLHASGYDSRVISGIIKELHKERGDEWLGWVLFICTRTEGAAFKRIMEYQGWEPKQYMVCNELLTDEEELALILDFASVYRYVNGASNLPTNHLYYPVTFAERMGRIPPAQNITVWLALHANEVFQSAPKGPEALNLRFQGLYYHEEQGDFLVRGGKAFMPFIDSEVVRAVAGLNPKTSPNRMRQKLVATIDPKLAELPNTNKPGDKGKAVSQRLMRALYEDYEGSELARHFKRLAPREVHRKIDYSPWWLHYTAAAMIEWYIRTGRRVVWK